MPLTPCRNLFPYEVSFLILYSYITEQHLFCIQWSVSKLYYVSSPFSLPFASYDNFRLIGFSRLLHDFYYLA